MYVMRDESGKINGVFTLPQPGIPVEYMDASDPEILEFYNNAP